MLVFQICQAQTGSKYEPVRYVGGESIDPSVHDGRLRYAVGVESRQTVRVNRTHPEWVEGSGWTYSHASNLAYWNDTFYQQYLSNPVDEHISPGQTLITTSKDGRHWSKPVVVFPPYIPPDGVKIPEGSEGYMMHQRMGFYVTPGNRLLVLAFYGHSEDPFMEGGIGRVVREAYKDGSFGPIYFIRYDSHTQWNETNTSYPFFTSSDDPGFIQACNALLEDKLKTLQWWDEDRGLDGFYTIKEAGSALSYYHRKDGKVVALWKRSLSALSDNEGISFSSPVKCSTFVMAGGKQWGQRTDDGRFAICYNPINMDEHRYPLITVTSDDGIMYDDMLIVQGEVPPRRFFGRWKDYGPCYVRGIAEGNGNPPGDDMWLTYSMNKEDIWVSRVPIPVRYQVKGPVNDDFENMEIDGSITGWNIHAPQWAPVSVSQLHNNPTKVLMLQDYDPFDYARAIRVFEEGNEKQIAFTISSGQIRNGLIEIEVCDRYGNRPVQLKFAEDGFIKALNGSIEHIITPYQAHRRYKIILKVNATPRGSFDLDIDGVNHLQDAALTVAVKSVERISFRTGPYRDLPNRKTDNEKPHDPLPGADEPVAPAVFYIDDVVIP